MTAMGERAYTYAKACGMLGKSYVGPRIAQINNVSHLNELDRLLFPENPGNLPEKQLLVDLEHRIANRSARQIINLVSHFSKAPEVLSRLIRSYEYADLKAVLTALAAKDTHPPKNVDIESFQSIRFSLYPDLEAMVKNTEYEWVTQAISQDPMGLKMIDTQIRLDQRYYTFLWEALQREKKSQRLNFEKLLIEEIRLKNIIWALRLRVYYGFSAEDIKKSLVNITMGSLSLVEPALKTLDFSTDQRSDWRTWSEESLLNPEQSGQLWRLDPRYVQNAAAGRLYHLARTYFHRRPFTLDTTACFIKLKQFEEDLLTSVAEGLILGLPARDVISMLGVHP
jgi:vacuolar-type H+-ATPase subunit C/Vma6